MVKMTRSVQSAHCSWLKGSPKIITPSDMWLLPPSHTKSSLPASSASVWPTEAPDCPSSGLKSTSRLFRSNQRHISSLFSAVTRHGAPPKAMQRSCQSSDAKENLRVYVGDWGRIFNFQLKHMWLSKYFIFIISSNLEIILYRVVDKR